MQWTVFREVAETLTPIPIEELQLAAAQGRIQEKDVAKAVATWDSALGASYIREKALALGVAPHTRKCRVCASNTQRAQLPSRDSRDITVHQLRTYLTFAKVFQPYHIKIINYYADTDEWHPLTWFLSAEHRKLVKSEMERIKLYREKGGLLQASEGQ